MAIIGPKITALGDTDFIKAQIKPDRQIKPLSFHLKLIETRRMIPIDVRKILLKGTRRLCRKLPKTISDDAQRQPTTAALSQVILSFRSGFIYNTGFGSTGFEKLKSGCAFCNHFQHFIGIRNPGNAQDIDPTGEKRIGNQAACWSD